MNKITLLPEEVANKIAAGEVIERPASIVKELVENSIDSGAKQIKIEIHNAGIDEIKVTDDGYGITEEDLPLSIIRHGTSKILKLSDLSLLVLPLLLLYLRFLKFGKIKMLKGFQFQCM